MYSNMMKFALAMVPVAMGSNIMQLTETDLIYYSTSETLSMSVNSNLTLNLEYDLNGEVWIFDDGSVSSANLEVEAEVHCQKKGKKCVTSWHLTAYDLEQIDSFDMIKPDGEILRMPVNIVNRKNYVDSARRHLTAFSENEIPTRECNRAERAVLKQALREDEDMEAAGDIPAKLLIDKCTKQVVHGAGIVFEAGFA